MQRESILCLHLAIPILCLQTRKILSTDNLTRHKSYFANIICSDCVWVCAFWFQNFWYDQITQEMFLQWTSFRSIQDCKARGVTRIAPMCALTLVARSFQIWPGKCSWHLQIIDQPEVGTRPCWGETLPDGAQWNDFVDVAKLHGKIQRKLCKGKGNSFWWCDWVQCFIPFCNGFSCFSGCDLVHNDSLILPDLCKIQKCPQLAAPLPLSCSLCLQLPHQNSCLLQC